MSTSNSQDVALRPGTRVGDYRIVAQIGQGGMGTVYRAVHALLETPFAIKVLRADRAWDAGAVARFTREAKLVSRLRDPGIVRVFGFGELPDGRRYQVMEYLDGISLREHLILNKRLGLPQTLAIIGPVASALEAAHVRGVIHRDVKPANILLTAAGVKLLDFGIAKLARFDEVAELSTTTGQLTGTPQYMSPEQCRGRGIDLRTDIYSLALVARECLTGQQAFGGQTLGEMLLAQQTNELPLASATCPELPRSVDAPLRRALSKKAAERHSSALGFALDLARAAGLPLPVPAAGATTPGEASRGGSWPLPSTFGSSSSVAREAPRRGPGTLLFHGQRRSRFWHIGWLVAALLGLTALGFLWRQLNRGAETEILPSPGSSRPAAVPARPDPPVETSEAEPPTAALPRAPADAGGAGVLDGDTRALPAARAIGDRRPSARKRGRTRVRRKKRRADQPPAPEEAPLIRF